MENNLSESKTKIEQAQKKQIEIYDNIQKSKSELGEIVIRLNDEIEKCENSLKDANNKASIDLERFKILVSDYFQNIQDLRTKDLPELKRKYLERLQAFYIDFKKVEKEDIGKRELLKQLSDLIHLRKEFLQHEVEYLKTRVLHNHHEIVNIYFHTLKNLESFSLYSELFIKHKSDRLSVFKRILGYEHIQGLYEIERNSAITRKTGEFFKEFQIKMQDEISPTVFKVFDDNIQGLIDIYNLIIDKAKNLNLQKNQRFIYDMYSANNLNSLFKIKYISFRQNDSNEELPLYNKIINKNFNKLILYSKIFEDDFTEKLLHSTNLVETQRFPSKNEIISQYKNIKHDFLYEIFLNKYEDYDIFGFMLRYFISRTMDVFFDFYSPEQNPIKANDSKIVKKIKAFSFINKYIHQGNFLDAFHYFQYIDNIQVIKEFKENIHLMIQKDMVLELLEHHYH